MSHLPADFHRRLEVKPLSDFEVEDAFFQQTADPLGIVQNISRPAPLCACFPGSCRGGEVIDGKLANGSLCQSCL